MADWIFQGNPDRFDVDRYLSTHRHIYWTVARHQQQVQKGDRVFLWRAAGSRNAIAGIVGVGAVADGVAPKGEVHFPQFLGDLYGRAKQIRRGK